MLTLVVSQRIVVAASCAIFYLLAKLQHASQDLRIGLLAILVLMACIEKLAAIMNLVSVERDWVVVVAKNNSVALRGVFHSLDFTTSTPLQWLTASHRNELADEAHRSDL